ncbi:unnamed protein product [Trichobilharzia regenti]|nr:unnamed protein product [Trichobilharzia regenti]
MDNRQATLKEDCGDLNEMAMFCLGPTVKELGDLSGIPVIAKRSFTMLTDEVMNILELGSHIDSVLICGIETHVCVQSTALDLLERGIQVHCIVDAVSSRNMVDRTHAKQIGYVSGSEANLLTCWPVFELMSHNSSVFKFRLLVLITLDRVVAIGKYFEVGGTLMNFENTRLNCFIFSGIH